MNWIIRISVLLNATLLILQGNCFLREAPERANGSDRRAGNGGWCLVALDNCEIRPISIRRALRSLSHHTDDCDRGRTSVTGLFTGGEGCCCLQTLASAFEDLAERLALLTASLPVKLTLAPLRGWQTFPEDDTEALRALVESVRPEVVVVDSISRLYGRQQRCRVGRSS
jgi:hypothetical protein